jgi:DNA-binding NarL/FixJ family response regulator
MSETITRLVVDLSKPEGHPERVQSIPLTAEELAERELMAAQAEAEQLAREAEETAKAEAKESAIAKLSALGLTESEIAALIA